MFTFIIVVAAAAAAIVVISGNRTGRFGAANTKIT
jgi:hypothetical protein